MHCKADLEGELESIGDVMWGFGKAALVAGKDLHSVKSHEAYVPEQTPSIIGYVCWKDTEEGLMLLIGEFRGLFLGLGWC